MGFAFRDPGLGLGRGSVGVAQLPRERILMWGPGGVLFPCFKFKPGSQTTIYK